MADLSMELWTSATVECAHSSAAMGFPGIHGHSYRLQFFCETTETSPIHLGDLEAGASMIHGLLDHKNLDEIMPTATMEDIIVFVLAHWRGPRLTRVRVRRDTLGCGVEWKQ